MHFWWFAMFSFSCTFLASEGKRPKVFESRRVHIHIPYAGLCRDNPWHITNVQNLTITYVGNKVVVHCRGVIFKNFDLSKVVGIFHRCASSAEEKNCEYFQTWRFGHEACVMLLQENMIWSEIFLAIHPRLKCPIEKGHYRVVNASLNADLLHKTFGTFIEKHVWRVRIEIYDPEEMTACIGFGVQFVR